jgi:hypothetical protein
MSRLKITGALLAVVAIAAMGAFSASAASAAVFTLGTAECKEGFWNLCWAETAAGALKELSGTQSGTVAKKTGSANAIFNVASVGVTIECKNVTSSDALINQEKPLTKNSTITGHLVFKECKLTGELGEVCTIPVEKTTEALTGEVVSETELKLKPTSTKAFITIPFEGASCPATVKGSHEVTGEDVIVIEKPGTPETTKSGANSTTKSTLKFSEKTATLTDEVTISFTGLGDLVDVSLA